MYTLYPARSVIGVPSALVVVAFHVSRAWLAHAVPGAVARAITTATTAKIATTAWRRAFSKLQELPFCTISSFIMPYLPGRDDLSPFLSPRNRAGAPPAGAPTLAPERETAGASYR